VEGFAAETRRRKEKKERLRDSSLNRGSCHQARSRAGSGRTEKGPKHSEKWKVESQFRGVSEMICEVYKSTPLVSRVIQAVKLS
jgi:hypothetical protein